MEITTGMSAPPIGMMISTPSARVMRTMIQKVTPDWPLTKAMIMTMVSRPRPRLSQCCIGKTTGLPETSP